MGDSKKPEFKTLLQEEREKGQISKLTSEQKKKFKLCPNLTDDAVCEWSIKYSNLPPFQCHGRYYEDGCSVWKKVQGAGGDPSVLIR